MVDQEKRKAKADPSNNIIPDENLNHQANGHRKQSKSNKGKHSVSRLTPFFDLTGSSSSCSARFGKRANIAENVGSVVLQIPSSSISVPPSASAMAVTVRTNSSASFFQTLTPMVSHQTLASVSLETLADDLPRRSACGSCVMAASCSRPGSISNGRDREPVVSAILQGSGGEEGVLVAASRVSGCSSVDMVVGEIEEEDVMRKWLQALDFQAVGACRSDERLRPLLRWNVSCFGADGRLLARLGLHFKARELSSLAHYLFTPLVSIRVGKIMRHGFVLRPTSTR